MSKHTPGPWEADRTRDVDSQYHRIDGPTPKGLNSNIPYAVADTLNRHFCIDPEEDAANAQLIATAPELLEACKRLLVFNEELCQDVNVSIHYPSAEFARKIIAKAEAK